MVQNTHNRDAVCIMQMCGRILTESLTRMNCATSITGGPPGICAGAIWTGRMAGATGTTGGATGIS